MTTSSQKKSPRHRAECWQRAAAGRKRRRAGETKERAQAGWLQPLSSMVASEGKSAAAAAAGGTLTQAGQRRRVGLDHGHLRLAAEHGGEALLHLLLRHCLALGPAEDRRQRLLPRAPALRQWAGQRWVSLQKWASLERPKAVCSYPDFPAPVMRMHTSANPAAGAREPGRARIAERSAPGPRRAAPLPRAR